MKKWYDDEISTLKKMFFNGCNIYDMAKNMTRTTTAVSSKLRELGLTKKVYYDSLVGNNFGELTLISWHYEKKGRQNVGIAICQCSCGLIKNTNLSFLINGRTISCGCLGKKQVTEYSSYITRISKNTPHRNNASGIKGIAFDKASGKWRAHINHNGKKYNSQRCNTKQEALVERKKMEERFFKPIINNYKADILKSKQMLLND